MNCKQCFFSKIWSSCYVWHILAITEKEGSWYFCIPKMSNFVCKGEIFFPPHNQLHREFKLWIGLCVRVYLWGMGILEASLWPRKEIPKPYLQLTCCEWHWIDPWTWVSDSLQFLHVCCSRWIKTTVNTSTLSVQKGTEETQAFSGYPRPKLCILQFANCPMVQVSLAWAKRSKC